MLTFLFTLLPGCSDYDFKHPSDAGETITGEDGSGGDGGHGDDGGSTDTRDPGVDDPRQPDDSSFEGDVGSGDGTWTESWTVDESFLQVDVLVFGDTSSSMEEELETLGDQITVFVEALAANSNDWHLMAVTGPSPCEEEDAGDWLDESDSNYAERFASDVTSAPGPDDMDEWGLHNADEVLWESLAGGCKAGFLRDDAFLHVIFLSDEDDNSPGWDEDSDYWEDYVGEVRNLKGDEDNFRFSAVIGPTPDGCEGDDGVEAEPGYGYADAVEETQGEVLSICTSWEDQLDVLADASNSLRFFLSSSPDPISSIAVTVNGVPASGADWAYVEDGNYVEFEAGTLAAGDDVRIVYAS